MTASDISLDKNSLPGLSILQTQAGYACDGQYALIKVAGQDSRAFLQSQLSNDVNALKPGQGQFTCLLDRKAHVKSFFHLYRDFDPDEELFYILIEKEYIANLIDNIEQYRFAAQVDFVDICNTGKFFAIQGPRVNRIFNTLKSSITFNTIASSGTCKIDFDSNRVYVFRHSITGENGYFLWVNNEDFLQFKNSIEKHCQELGFIELNDGIINQARVEAGLLKYGIDFDENNLLPETGLVDKTVSYTKGCFVGQEILARVKSHGVPAKAIIGIVIDTDMTFSINSPIKIAGEEIGTVKSNIFSPKLNKLIALALLKKDYRVPDKHFTAEIEGYSLNATVKLLPFIEARSNKELADTLYKKAVEKYVHLPENIVPTESINLLKEVLILDPYLEDALEALAVMLSKHGEIEQAIALMKTLGHSNPDSVMAHTNLSVFYVQQGLKELAEEEKAIALSIRMRLAAAQMSNKHKEETDNERVDRLRRMEMFSQVLTIDAEDFFANAGMGECLVQEKEFAKAIPYLIKAIELKPIHLAAYFDLATAYKGIGKVSSEVKDILNEGIAIATKRGDTAGLQKLQDEMERLIRN